MTCHLPQILTAVVLIFGELIYCKNILILGPMAPKSHHIIFQSMATALAQRGHRVTLVSSSQSSFDDNDLSAENITQIVAGNYQKFVQQIQSTLAWQGGTLLDHLTFAMDPILEGCHQIYQNQPFMALSNETIDLIFVDSFFHECLMGFVSQFGGGGVPFVILAGLPPPTFSTEITGNRLPASFVPNFLTSFLDDMTFFQRFLNFLLNIVMETFLYLSVVKESENIYRHYLGPGVPNLVQINQNVAMIMINSHYITNYPRPTLPDVIEIGGVHCRPPKRLPKDLHHFVNGSGQAGIILFSMGSIVQGQLMPEKMREIFLNVFSRLKERIIWKWESGLMMEDQRVLPKNIKLVRWLPQQDILGHLKTKLFLTHGGLNSMAEALYHSVPVIGLPVFADQEMNVNKAVRNGYALKIDLAGLTENILESRIRQILNEKRFSKNVQKYSKMYRDQPTSPLERAVYWSEFLMRHKGGRELRSAARGLNFFQYYCVDVMAVIFLLLATSFWLTCFLFRLSCQSLRKFVDNFLKLLFKLKIE